MNRALPILFCLMLCRCGTVTPDYIVAHEIRTGSDGFQDAGIKGQVIQKSTGQHMLLLTAQDKAIYDADVDRFGSLFTPPLVKNDGWLPFGKMYAVRNDALINFSVLRALETKEALGVYEKEMGK